MLRHHEDKEKRRAVVQQVTGLVTAGRGPGLVYAAKRKDTEKYAARLARNGLRAAAYHAGRTPTERELVHQQFLDGGLDVVVATTAFGMGIDKPDVRFVLHADIPESLDSYYQQIGRAGRDGLPAVAVLHYRSEDLGLRRYFATHTPDEAALLAVLTVLREAGRPLAPEALAEWTGFPARRITGLLNLLQETGAVTAQTTTASGSRWHSTRGGPRPRGGTRRRPRRRPRARGQVAHRHDPQLRRNAPLPPPVPARLLRRGPARALRELRHLHRRHALLQEQAGSTTVGLPTSVPPLLAAGSGARSR